MISNDDFRSVVAVARLAPSVHNIQPTRWALDPDGTVRLLEDLTRSIPAADPTGHDVRLSHGAALEGLSIALAARGLDISDVSPVFGEAEGRWSTIARISLKARRTDAVPSDLLVSRTSWRGPFLDGSPEAEARLDLLASSRDDIVILRSREEVRELSRMADDAGFQFMIDPEYRKELLHWMRLSRGHRDYGRDGLSREAMHLSAVEAAGARLVIGPFFDAFRRMGLARAVLSEASKNASSAAFVLFHRPFDEDPFETGRHFLRVWLEIERAGLAGCPVSALADLWSSNQALTGMGGLADDRLLVNVFKVGCPRGNRTARHERLPVSELVVGSTPG